MRQGSHLEAAHEEQHLCARQPQPVCARLLPGGTGDAEGSRASQHRHVLPSLSRWLTAAMSTRFTARDLHAFHNGQSSHLNNCKADCSHPTPDRAITRMQAGGSHLRNATCRSARSISCVGRMPPSPGSMSRPITCTRNSNSCSLLIGIEPLGVSCTTKQHRQVTQVSGHARSRWRSQLFTRVIRWHACA